MQSRSDLHHKQIFLTLLILFSGITRQPLLFKVAYENTGRCINSFYEHKDFIIYSATSSLFLHLLIFVDIENKFIALLL